MNQPIEKVSGSEKEDNDLCKELDDIYREALNIWQEQYMREFTAHGPDHIKQVEKNLDVLVSPLLSTEVMLTPVENFVLLAACYLHDIGMQVDDPHARAKHAQYAYELILNSSVQMGNEKRRVALPINDNNAREAIAEVARAHWTENALKLDKRDKIYGNDSGRLRLLGLLLAMADLLDISPVRARYFRMSHQLYDLSPLSELHQVMHERVKGFDIIPDELNDLQFQLSWRDESDTTHQMNDWVICWFHCQWRLLSQGLYTECHARIRWKTPWATVKFGTSQGEVQTLSKEALHILEAQITEQRRIDRDEFVECFKKAVDISGKKQTVLFRYPGSSDLDSHHITKWCEAYANIQQECRVARVDIPPGHALDLASIIAQLMEQWGEKLQECSDSEALDHLCDFILSDHTHSLVSIVVTEEYSNDLLGKLIETLVCRPPDQVEVGRICLLVARDGGGPERLNNAKVYCVSADGFSKGDIIKHLRNQWGYDDKQSEEIYLRMEAIDIVNRPGQVYNYIQTHCGIDGL